MFVFNYFEKKALQIFFRIINKGLEFPTLFPLINIQTGQQNEEEVHVHGRNKFVLVSGYRAYSLIKIKRKCETIKLFTIALISTI